MTTRDHLSAAACRAGHSPRALRRLALSLMLEDPGERPPKTMDVGATLRAPGTGRKISSRLVPIVRGVGRLSTQTSDKERDKVVVLVRLRLGDIS